MFISSLLLASRTMTHVNGFEGLLVELETHCYVVTAHETSIAEPLGKSLLLTSGLSGSSPKQTSSWPDTKYLCRCVLFK